MNFYDNYFFRINSSNASFNFGNGFTINLHTFSCELLSARLEFKNNAQNLQN